MNINHEYLEKVWSSIVGDDSTAYDYKRIDGECIPELSLGLDSKGYRCLVLELPHYHKVDFQPAIRKNLTLKLYHGTMIILELKNSQFTELFNDLVISLYQSIQDVSAVDEYSSIFINTFYKWSDFFSEREFDKLSEEAVKGMLGELIVLGRFLRESSSIEINAYLQSWKGPYDKGKDFELDDKDIEVKTKNLNKININISSEHQLEPNIGKGLELWVVSVQPRHDKGLTLNELIIELNGIIINKLGELSIFKDALWQKGLTVENSSYYDHYKFIPKTLTSYNASTHDFPALKKSHLNSAIAKVRYDLNLTFLDNYLIEEVSL